MRKLFTLLLLALSVPSMWARQLHITTPHLSLVVNAEQGKTPEFVYFGRRLSAGDLAVLPAPVGGRMDLYPAYGLNPANEAALSIRHSDGDMTTVLKVTGAEQTDTLTTIHLRDPLLCTKHLTRGSWRSSP